MMSSVSSVVRRHPIITFFVLSYAISWAFLPIESVRFLPSGPLFAALIVIPLTQGVAGLKELGLRMIRWRVRWYWYAAAIGVPLAVHLVIVGFNVAAGAGEGVDPGGHGLRAGQRVDRGVEPVDELGDVGRNVEAIHAQRRGQDREEGEWQARGALVAEQEVSTGPGEAQSHNKLVQVHGVRTSSRLTRGLLTVVPPKRHGGKYDRPTVLHTTP